MYRFWNNKKITWISILAIAICGSMLTYVSSYAVERQVDVENHTFSRDYAMKISGITISVLNKPTAGTSLDSKADVSTAEGDKWEIPVIWVRDDLQIDSDICDEGHSYLPVLAYFVPGDYAIDGDTYIITLSDDLTALFGTNEVISCYDVNSELTYILPTSLRDLFIRGYNGNKGTDPEVMPGQSQTSNKGTVSDTMPGQDQKGNQDLMNAINLLKDKVAVLEAKDLHVADVKAKGRKGRKALITWKENKQASGYQICYSTRKDFKKAGKSVTVNKASIRTKWLKKLRAGKTCYVKVRTVKKFNSAVTGKMITVYGRWSATRRFKVKR